MIFSELYPILKKVIDLNKPRLECLINVVVSLISFRTVNFSVLAAGLTGDAQLDSKTKRIKRLLAHWPERMDWLGPFLFGWFDDLTECHVELMLDRTNWSFGQTQINFLMVCIVYKKTGIPFMLTLLNKKGNSNTQERIELMQRVLKYIKPQQIINLSADREFIGEAWFQWLSEHQIPFKIRLKHNLNVPARNGMIIRIDWLFNNLKPGDKTSLFGKWLVLNQPMYLSASRLKSGELMIIGSSDKAGCAVQHYCQRWSIETFFQNLKSRGFNLESTHLISAQRLVALMQILMIASCWSLKSGETMLGAQQKTLPRSMKTGRLKISLFKYGLDQIRQAISRHFSGKYDHLLIDIWCSLKIPRLLIIFWT
jgi:hypothetical protein